MRPSPAPQRLSGAPNSPNRGPVGGRGGGRGGGLLPMQAARGLSSAFPGAVQPPLLVGGEEYVSRMQLQELTKIKDEQSKLEQQMSHLRLRVRALGTAVLPISFLLSRLENELCSMPVPAFMVPASKKPPGCCTSLNYHGCECFTDVSVLKTFTVPRCCAQNVTVRLIRI